VLLLLIITYYYYYYFILLLVLLIIITIIIIILYILLLLLLCVCVCLFPKLLHETRPLSIFALEIPLESHVAARRSRAVGKGLPSARKLG